MNTFIYFLIPVIPYYVGGALYYVISLMSTNGNRNGSNQYENYENYDDFHIDLTETLI